MRVSIERGDAATYDLREELWRRVRDGMD